MDTQAAGSNMMSYPLRLERILERAERWFGATAVVGSEPGGPIRRSSYGELGRRARRLAAGLRSFGLEPGERVATLLWNQTAHLEAYFGVPLAGGVVHPLNLRLHPRQLAAIVRDAGDRFAIVDRSLMPLWQAIGAGARAIVYPGEYEPWLARCEPGPIAAGTDENAGAAMGYTSGTTGEPKGVVYSHRALVLHALAVSLPDAMGLRESDCVLPLVSMFHANAWGIPHAAALIGCKLALLGGHFDAIRALDLLASEDVTFSAGVATVWQEVLDALDRHPGRWELNPKLRVNLGGAPASSALFQRFDDHGIAVHMGWGMTEMSPVGALNPLHPEDAARRDAAARLRAGRVLPLVEARLARGAPEGGLEVRGAWVADSYHGGAGAGAWTGGAGERWLRTGDVARFDAQGLLEIVDRESDMIRSGGEWISSVALETALAECPGVREAAVIAVPHPKWQERPLALVVLEPGAGWNPGGLFDRLRRSFAAWQCPDEYREVVELPRTATGKLDKRELRRRYREEYGGNREAIGSTIGPSAGQR